MATETARLRRRPWAAARALACVAIGVLAAAAPDAEAQSSRERLGYYRRDSDEASRQRMSQQFRADAERMARRNEETRSRYSGTSGGNSGGGSGSNSSSRQRGGPAPLLGGSGAADDGPQSIESTRTETFRVRETEAETVQRILREAAQGQVESMWNAGRLLATGGFGGVARDDARALAWFRKAAEAGHGEAATALGESLLFGRGTAADAAQAVRWLKAGAEAGVARAQLQYGSALFRGDGGLARDVAAAASWLRKAADGGEVHAMWFVGEEMRTGGLWPKDAAAARRVLRQAAEQGQPLAARSLADMCMTGEGGAQDHAEARRWYVRAAEAGDTDATHNAALMLFRGQGGPVDARQGEALLRAAAERGDAQAQFDLGARLYEGAGLTQNHAEAARRLEPAAAGKHADAQALLGFMIAYEKGVPANAARALALMRAAAEAGSVLGADYLGECLFIGPGGITRDLTEAARWNRVAAEKGRWFAQLRWGYQLKHGLGTAANGREAYRWLKAALDNGLEQAREHLDPAFVAANR